MRRLYGDSSGTTPSESLSYTYTGPKRNTWTYDAHGNVTADPQAGLGIEWNAIGLPRTITASSGTDTASTQRFYLADGSLAQVSDGTTTRLYLGDMVFEKAANGTVTLESAGWEGGRLLPGTGADKILYVVKDHLGSVRVVKDGTGAVRQRFDYYPYGTVSRVWTSSATTDDSEKRYRFGGKEVAGSALTDLAGEGSAPGAPYLDFGARMYSPSNMRWMTMDPLAEKYYHISPYAYCAGNPVNLVDPEGKEIWIVLNKDQKNEERLQYESGTLLYSNGDVYTGDDPFVLQVLESLNRIESMKNKRIHEVITTLISSPKQHIITKDSSNQDETGVVNDLYGKSFANEGESVEANIHVTLQKRVIENDLKNSPTITIGHELMHAYDYDRGNYKGMIPAPYGQIDPMEVRAVYFENLIRKELGFPIRTTYNKRAISPVLLSKVRIP